MSTYIVALISENGVFSFSSHNIMVQYFAVFFFFFSFFLNSKLGNNLVWSCLYQSLHMVDHLTTICLICLILFQDCPFSKLQSNSALRVSFQGNMRVEGTGSKCNRWYFKFNGNECSGPMTIEAVVYNYWPSGNNPTLLHHRSFEGYCENIPQGAVRVELWVGQCTGQTLGNAYTGWNSVSRIMIEEVSRSQS